MEQRSADIVIIGGGIAGFAAALRAKEAHQRVLIIERNAHPGGNATQANVGTICGAYFTLPGQPLKPVGYPISPWFLSEVGRLSGTRPLVQTNGLAIVPYEWLAMQRFLVQELSDRGITLLPQTEITHISTHENRIKHVTVVHQGTTVQITAGAVIDCSGNGIVSSLLGLEMLEENTYQAASQIFRVHTVSCSDEYPLEMALKRITSRLHYGSHSDARAPSLSVVPGSLRGDQVDLKLNLPDTITDHEPDHEAIRQRAVEEIHRLFPLLKSSISYFKTASEPTIFPQLGVRVMHRSLGQHILQAHDVLEGKKYQDAVAIGTWPMEEWGYDGKVKLTFCNSPDGYDIPATCLMSNSIGNLYFAGKNISASGKAISSARVMGTCLQTGYAAGAMASCETVKDRQHAIQELSLALSKCRP